MRRGERRTAMKRRRVLLTIAALGSVVTLLGLVGLIAPFTDRATTGPNSIQSGERAREVDLKLATTDPNGVCGAFVDDLTTGVISVSSVQPSSADTGAGLCFRNAGASPASVSFTALDLSDVDTACTGDEATVDVLSCGSGVGELSPQLSVGFMVDHQCDGQTLIYEQRLPVLSTTSMPFGTLAPGQVWCLSPYWSYFPTTADAPTMAQTDEATWRFAIDGAQSIP
jgi:hypothetical protein